MTKAEHPYYAFSRWLSSDYTDAKAKAAVHRALGTAGARLLKLHAAGDAAFWDGEIEGALLAKYGAPSANARQNPSANDRNITVAKLHLKRIAPGVYEHVNRATGTTWRVVKRESNTPSWTFRNAESNREGGGDVYATKALAAEGLVHYLRGRYFDDRFGWCTR